MAALLGKPFPSNSVGVLPDIYSIDSLGFLENQEASIIAGIVNAKVRLNFYILK